MNQFDTILVPLDESLQDEVAIPAALDEALRHNARMVLLYVIERPETPPTHPSHGGPIPVSATHQDEEFLRERDAARSYLQQIQHRHHLFANVELCIRHGDPVRQIELEAKTRKRPLVIMAIAQIQQDGADAQFERVTRLVHQAKCQLLLVNPTLPTRRNSASIPREYIAPANA